MIHSIQLIIADTFGLSHWDALWMNTLNSLANRLLPHDTYRRLFSIVRAEKFARYQQLRTVTDGEYSYLPFDRTQSIFIHIPKAAGSSVCLSLYGNLAGGHTPMDQYRVIFSKEEFNKYFKFTFVRNPWDRLYSAYTFLKAGGLNQDDKEWSSNNLARLENFEDFVLNWLSPTNLHSYIHFKPQLDLLTIPHTNKMPLNYVGFFENLQSDFEHIKRIVNPDATLKHDNKTLVSTSTGYRNSYTDAMIKKVGYLYRKDIEVFGYSFDNSTIQEQIGYRDNNSFNHIKTG